MFRLSLFWALVADMSLGQTCRPCCAIGGDGVGGGVGGGGDGVSDVGGGAGNGDVVAGDGSGGGSAAGGSGDVVTEVMVGMVTVGVMGLLGEVMLLGGVVVVMVEVEWGWWR